MGLFFSFYGVAAASVCARLITLKGLSRAGENDALLWSGTLWNGAAIGAMCAPPPPLLSYSHADLFSGGGAAPGISLFCQLQS
jgi:hypothetical protein